MNEEKRRKILADAQSKMRFAKNVPKVDAWMSKLEAVVERSQRHVKQICQAGGAIKDSDKTALRETLLGMLLQEFDRFDKEELMMFAAVTVGDRLMQEVEANPWGRETPDALGGV